MTALSMWYLSYLTLPGGLEKSSPCRSTGNKSEGTTRMATTLEASLGRFAFNLRNRDLTVLSLSSSSLNASQKFTPTLPRKKRDIHVSRLFWPLARRSRIEISPKRILMVQQLPDHPDKIPAPNRNEWMNLFHDAW